MRQPEDRRDRAYLADYGEDDESQLPPEDRIDWDDRDRLLVAVARVFNNRRAAGQLLTSIRVRADEIPDWGDGDSSSWWTEMFNEFDSGLISDPYRRLISAAHRRYRRNRTFADLRQRYIDLEQPAEPAVSTTCHVVVRVSDDDERTEAAEILGELGLRPNEVWATEHATSFAVNSSDTASVGRLLGGTQLGFTVVPPGAPDYLLRELYVQGPDGSRFRLVDAPAQQTVANVAAEVVNQYSGGDPGEAARPTVVDRVDPQGDLSRISPDQTLDEAGFEDGDNMRIGFEGRAGAVNPVDWQDAIDRVFKQVRAFAEAHQGMLVRANSATLPTEYEIEFRQPGFGPPPGDGVEPVAIDEHRLRITLGPDFPEVAPNVFWLTPVFHPNVFPMYDSDAARERPELQGLVCLGMLAESWQPALDFGDLVQTLIDIAGYRNYELFLVDQDDTGTSWRVNYFDHTAARWAAEHQEEIVAIGGSALLRSTSARPGYRNVIVAVD